MPLASTPDAAVRNASRFSQRNPFKIPVDLVRRREEQRYRKSQQPQLFEQRDVPAHSLRIVTGCDETGGNGRLRREMKHRTCLAHASRSARASRMSPRLEIDKRAVCGLQPLEVAFDAGPGKIVVNQDRRPGAQKPGGNIGSDEAGAAADRTGSLIPSDPRAASSLRDSATRSDAICPSSHAARSANPSSRPTLA